MLLLCTPVRLFYEYQGTDSIYFFFAPVCCDVSGVISNNPIIK